MKRQYTLVELIGAMVIALIVIGALLRIFGSSTTFISSKVKETETYAQARLSLKILERDLAMLYSGENVSHTISDAGIMVHSFGSVMRPTGGTEEEISNALAVAQKVEYLPQSNKLQRQVSRLDIATGLYSVDPDSTGELIESPSLVQFSAKAFFTRADGVLQESATYPVFYDHDNDSATAEIFVGKPDVVTLIVEIEAEGSVRRTFKKTFLTTIVP